MVYSLHEYQSKAREQLALTNKVLSSEHLAADADSASFVAPFTPVIATPPELKSVSAPDSEAKWVSFDKPLIYVYAGKGPWVSRDLMQFPVALPDDGLIDIVVQEQSLPRRGLLRAMDGSGTGQPYWMPSQHYIKAQAYRIEPCSRNNLLSIDGERYPFETFEVECLPRHATVLSPYGWWQAEFALPESNPK
ncbi:uncharacterized protein FIBRA_04482 [Fibroporia radiculosa]|uniref:YegS/DAGK C-terminal domain-containing protein n=1 Tax=Fibroporia radiculosa TaxID=599839 RepID=J4IA68_9APHY|nr:uncharacterized protein FIBRA_04482 [Fibroporia radiculosa]CCM02386.1 predicted protein [Fibroporia radiculosa]